MCRARNRKSSDALVAAEDYALTNRKPVYISHVTPQSETGVESVNGWL